jgi:hypothetical protein
MNRFPSNRLRVEFDGPDVSQEMLYTLFRVSLLPLPFLRHDGIAEMIAIRSSIGYNSTSTRPSRLSALCNNILLPTLPSSHSHQCRTSCIISSYRANPDGQLHGYSTPTNTADFTLRASGRPSEEKITLSRLRLYYERPLKAHAIRDWLSSHPRLVLPALAFLIGTLSYTVSPLFGIKERR